MINHRLSNILLNPAEHLMDHHELYARTSGSLIYDTQAKELRVSGTADFTTYLNACSVHKWRTYCGLTHIWLHLELTGDDATIIMTGVAQHTAVHGNDSTILAQHNVSIDKTPTIIDFEIPCEGMDLVGFQLTSSGTTGIRRGYYYTQVDEESVRPIRIALCTTTFKKEHYIIPNIELMRSAVRANDGGLRTSFHMFVIDNGQTLDAKALSDDLVSVIPNSNVGGAGGFARGMLAALDAEQAPTHVILMDDDVRVFPESIERAFDLLSLAHDSYRDAFINGAMLSLEQPQRLYEDVSHVLRSGTYRKLKPDLCIDTLDQVAKAERISVEVPRAYGAWWFSCIPVSAIREHGLPLPVFVRCDDVEFGLRCNPTYMTMNGICVWHESFEGRPRASVDCYQFVRNFLVMAACDGYVNKDLFMSRVWRNVRLRLRDLEYGAAELLLDGVDDYLKGPDFLTSVDGAALMKKNAAKNDHFIALDDLDPAIRVDARLDQVHPRKHMPLPFVGKLAKTLPYDKHLIPDALLRHTPGHMQLTGPGTFDNDTLACDTILVLSATNDSVAVRQMDRERNAAIHARARKLKKRYQLEHQPVEKAYQEAFPTLTSPEFWRKYLSL